MAHPLHVHAARYRARKKLPQVHILSDIGIIGISIIVAVILVQTHALTQFLEATKEFKLFGTFVTGMFFTSVFTTAPAIAMLGEIALKQPIVTTAFFAALGSVLGDLLIFQFVRDRVASDILELLRERGTLRRMNKLIKFRHFRWLTLLLGGLIIATPFPDELGIALLGFSKMRTKYFILLSFVFNFLGIVGIGFIARSIAGV